MPHSSSDSTKNVRYKYITLKSIGRFKMQTHQINVERTGLGPLDSPLDPQHMVITEESFTPPRAQRLDEWTKILSAPRLKDTRSGALGSLFSRPDNPTHPPSLFGSYLVGPPPPHSLSLFLPHFCYVQVSVCVFVCVSGGVLLNWHISTIRAKVSA